MDGAAAFQSIKIRTLADIEALEQGPLEDKIDLWTVYDLVCHGASLDPKRPAIHFLPTGSPDEAPETLTFGRFIGRVRQVANALSELGVGPKDAVAIMLPLVPQNYISLIAGTAAGIAAPVNWMLEPSQLTEIINATRAKVLVCLGPSPDFEIWDKVTAMRTRLTSVEHVLQVQAPGAARIDSGLDELADRQPGDRLVSGRQIRADDVAIYAHTGGTTGTPKIAQLQHKGFAYKCWAYEILLEQEAGQAVFAVHPLFHIGGMVYHTVSAFARGITSLVPGTVGFRNKAVVENYWRFVEKYRITDFFGVPTTLSALANIPVGDADVSSLRPYCMTGSAGLPVEIAEKFERDIGVRVLCNYGMTENTATIAVPPRDGEPRFGSAGFRLPYTEVRIVELDRDGELRRECDTDEAGLILVRSPGVIPGYLDQALDEDLFFGDGWINTGDLGRLDPDGYIWITGRIKDVINRSGHNIDPAIIEDALLTHEDVQLSAAVGRPDAYAGELPVAYVQLKPGASASEAELLAFARDRVPERAAIPKSITIMDALPLTGVGKIFKPALRDRAAIEFFEKLLAPLLHQGAHLEITPEDDARRGHYLSVRITGSGDREAVERALSAFAVPPEVIWR